MEKQYGIFVANGERKIMVGIEGSGLIKLNTLLFETPELATTFIDESDWIPRGPEYLIMPVWIHWKVHKVSD